MILRAVKEAARRARLTRPVPRHTRSHSFAIHLLDAGYGIRTIQEWPGHADVTTTMIHAHVLNRGTRGARSPLDDNP